MLLRFRLRSGLAAMARPSHGNPFAGKTQHQVAGYMNGAGESGLRAAAELRIARGKG